MAYIRQKTVLNTRLKGNTGEDIACYFLINKGFTIVDRNYRKAWGELDIVAEKDGVIHFFEVKSVTKTFWNDLDGHKPEENVHGLKIRRIRRMVQTYLSEKKEGIDVPFSFHVICVYGDLSSEHIKVKWINDIIL